LASGGPFRAVGADPWARPRRALGRGRRFQFCIERLQDVRRLFLQLCNFSFWRPVTRSRARSAARPCTTSCGFEASEPIPFPGADSIFSSLCGAISGRLHFAVAVARTSDLCAKPPTLLPLRHEFHTGLQPVPSDETGLPLFHAQAAFRGTNGFPCCFAASPPNDDPARSESAGGNGGGIKAACKPFSKLLQNSRVLLQAFPNKSLAILWDFNGLQGFQTAFDGFQIFRLRPPLSAAFWTPRDRIPLPRAAWLRAHPAARLILRCSLVDDAFIAEQRSR
jgi:hypothetical protein